eukprot:15473906-Alexandrium_andersonii.AAC.1
MQHGVRQTELELRGLGNDLKIGPRSSRGVRSVLCCAEPDGGDGKRPSRVEKRTLRTPTR